MRRLWLVFPILAIAAFWLAPQNLVHAQAPPEVPIADDSVVSLLVRFGLNDTEPRAWDGTLSTDGGEVINLRFWRPHPSDRIEGTTGWKLATRQGRNFRKRPWEPEPIVGTEPFVNIGGLIVDVRGSSGTKVRFKTSNGAFEVKPFELAPGEPARALGTAVSIERVPTAQMVSTPDLQNDYATLTAGRDGQLWTAWVAYADWKNHVRARRFDGNSWSDAEKVSGDHNDIFLVKAGRDSSGGVWFIWSSQVDGNWDLYGRRHDGNSWGAIERLTTAPQPDIYHAMTTDSKGNVWVVWQGFRNGRSDIFARWWDGSTWSAEERLSRSPANDWEPAIAADSKGRVWVGWDTYDKGNYDIVMSKYENGRWSELATIAATAKFEAHVSLACDKQDRLWAVWNESGTQWGKDTGFLIKREGTRLYQSRWMAAGVFDGGVWYEPVANIEDSLPEDLRGYNDMPLVEVDSTGRVWLLFRHRLPRMIDTPSDTPMHRAAWEIYATTDDGAQWTTPVAVPVTAGRTDMRVGVDADSDGNVWLAWG
ncbi:MAG: hypothetical protein GY953_30825, partial [bacterium]|nr:hypothetical protein [bacterium]